MANRAFKMILNSLVERLTYLQGTFQTDSDGDVLNPPDGSITGNGIKSVTHAGTGVYQIRLSDSYNRYFLGNAGVVSGIASPTADGSFTPGKAYMIAVLGTQTGTLTLTSPVAAHVYGVDIGGNTAKVVSSGSATEDCAALALLSNGIYVTVVPAVAGSSYGQYAVNVPATVLTCASVTGGPFTIDEVCTGSISGATGYVNSAANASPVTLVQVAAGAGGQSFIVGDVVTGGSSSAHFTTTGVAQSGVQVVVNTYPADNYLPVPNIANLVNATAVGITIVFTYKPSASSPTGVSNPAVTTVATNSAGGAAAFAEATMPATDWYAVGFDAGLTPAVSASFLATAAGGAGDGTASLPATATPAYGYTFQVLGNTETIINSPEGGAVYMVIRRTDTGALVDVVSGVCGFDMFLRNSSIKGQGE